MQAHKVEENEILKMALREKGRKWTYSNGNFGSSKLALFSVTNLMVSSAWKIDEVRKQRLREKSEEKES